MHYTGLENENRGICNILQEATISACIFYANLRSLIPTPEIIAPLIFLKNVFSLVFLLIKDEILETCLTANQFDLKLGRLIFFQMIATINLFENLYKFTSKKMKLIIKTNRHKREKN